MKTGVIATPTMVSSGMEKHIMGMSSRGADMATYFMRDKIYSNKILASVRETVTNSYDEHVSHNIGRAVEVKLSKNDEGVYTWSSRDFALGLCEEQIYSIFGTYFESTKSKSNKCIGGFGIGSAAPLSYSDSYMITSYYDGMKKTYCSTLGAGDNGIPVGEIYLISEEPTTETGIEISIDVTKDYWKFHDETKKFVENFLPNAEIEYVDYTGEIHTPKTPELTYEKNDYVVNAYKANYANSYVSIRMGGVIYEYQHRNPKSNVFKHKLIVDVPIGKLTIPISRESLEDTPNNQRVLKEIDDIIVEIYENDKKSLTVPKFGGYISNTKSSRQYEGTWCNYNISDLFPNTNKLRNIVQHTHKMYDEAIKPNANAKYIIYTFPEIRTYKSWVKRLEAVLTTDPDYSGYLAVFDTANVMANYSKNTETLDVSDCIFVDVKSLGLPKLVTTPKDRDDGPKEYVIYKAGDKDYKTIDGHDEDTDAEIYKDAEWYKSEKLTRNQFLNRCIGWANTNDDHIGHGQNNRFWTTGAKKMYEGLVELGFIEVGSQIYKDTLALIVAREQKQNDLDQAQSRIKSVTFKVGVLPQVANAVGKTPSKLDRLKNMKTKILLEDSPRARILKQIEDYSYRSNLTRSDLRMIMKLK